MKNFRTGTNDQLAHEILDKDSPINMLSDKNVKIINQHLKNDYENNRAISLCASGIFGTFTKHTVKAHDILKALLFVFLGYEAIDKERWSVKLDNGKIVPLRFDDFGLDNDGKLYHQRLGLEFKMKSIKGLHDVLFKRRKRRMADISDSLPDLAQKINDERTEFIYDPWEEYSPRFSRTYLYGTVRNQYNV